MTHPKSKRDWEIKQLVRAKLGGELNSQRGIFGVQKPKLDKATRRLTILTKDYHTTRFGEAPQGVIFRDGSFLTIAETWSAEGALLSFSYHYQKPDPARWRFFRYDREPPDPPPVDRPRHHLHVCSDLHYATGPMELEQVLDVIAELFRRHAEGEAVL